VLRDRRFIGHLRRCATLTLLLSTASTPAWFACGGDPATMGRSVVDPGPTYGLEVAISVKGRGRVVSVPAAIACPTTCYARIVLADRAIDAAAAAHRVGEVAVLAATGLQTRWSAVPPAHLAHIIAAYAHAGRSHEARMLAAEAVTRG